MKKIIDIICQPEVVMWGLVIIIPLVSKFATGIKYISVVDIIKNHLKCFTNKDGKYLLVPIVNYVVLPFLMGAATVQIKMIDASTIEIITVIVSILTAMLFTMLTMVIDMKGKINEQQLYCTIDIDMMSTLQQIIKVTFGKDIVTGVTTITVEGNQFVNVYALNGTLLRKEVKQQDALNDLQSGIYVVNGKKVIKK